MEAVTDRRTTRSGSSERAVSYLADGRGAASASTRYFVFWIRS